MLIRYIFFKIKKIYYYLPIILVPKYLSNIKYSYAILFNWCHHKLLVILLLKDIFLFKKIKLFFKI